MAGFAVMMVALTMQATAPADACVRALGRMHTPERAAELCRGVDSNVCFLTAVRFRTPHVAAELCRRIESDRCMARALMVFTFDGAASICRNVDRRCFSAMEQHLTLSGASDRCRRQHWPQRR